MVVSVVKNPTMIKVTLLCGRALKKGLNERAPVAVAEMGRKFLVRDVHPQWEEGKRPPPPRRDSASGLY